MAVPSVVLSNLSEEEFLISAGFSHHSMEVWVSGSRVARVHKTLEDFEEALDALNYFNIQGLEKYKMRTGSYVITHTLTKP